MRTDEKTDAPQLLSMQEAADWCHISVNTLSYLRCQGRFRARGANGQAAALACRGPCAMDPRAAGAGMILRRSNGKWRVKVKYRGVIVADRTFVRRGDAVRWETEQKRQLHEGDFVPPAAGRITVRELADEYRESRVGMVSVRAWESDESALRVHIVPEFGKLPISAVTSAQIERFLTGLAVSRSVRTSARIRTTVRGLFDYAVRTRHIRTSPAADVPLPRPESRTGKVVEFEPYSLELLLAVAESQRKTAGAYADLTVVLGLTGVRMGELRGLRVRDVVSVPYPAITVKRSVPQSARDGRPIERATTKSGRSRLVPLSDLVRPIVEEWSEGKLPEVLLFPGPKGGYLRVQSWRRMVRWPRTSLGRRPHDLRHTAASLWTAAGIDIKTVSAWLGHSTAKLTLDTYGHLMGTDADRAALARVNRLYGGPTGARSDDGTNLGTAKSAETGR